MDPVTMVAAALAAGASAESAETAKGSVREAYRVLRGLLVSGYAAVDVTAVEAEPRSRAARAALASELAGAAAGDDAELLAAARRLLSEMEHAAPGAAESVGVRLRRVRAGGIEISDVIAAGSAVIAEDVDADGTITITAVRAGAQEPPHPRAARQ
ncbi:hypothetical protein [Nocardia niwae]|uniref:Uncharacterized protein n=1 Tax=Nocardia niwae TaxID=626084 RepID=A0ABV2X7Q3_9NOCA